MFAKGGKKEKLWLPIVGFAVFAALSMLWYADYQEILLRPIMDKLAEEYGRDFVVWYKQITSAVSSKGTTVIGAATMFVTPIVGGVVTAAVAMIVCCPIFKGSVAFRALFSVAVYTGLIAAFGTLATIAVSVLLDTPSSIFAFSAIIGADTGNVVLDTVGSISIFDIARSVALYFGLNALLQMGDEPLPKEKASAAALTTVCVLFFGGLIITLVTLAASGGGMAAYDMVYRQYLNATGN